MTPSIGTIPYFIPPSLAIKPGNKVLSIGIGVNALESELAARVGIAGLLVIAEMSIKSSKQAVHAKLDSIDTKFDRIHCRLLLSEMPPRGARSTIIKMLNKLEIGGRLVLEEVHQAEIHAHLPYQQSKRTTTTTIENFLESLRYKVTHTPSASFFYNLESCAHPKIAQISLTKYY